MKTLQFIPILEKITTNDKLTNVWQNWFRDFYQIQKDTATIIDVDSKFSYNLTPSLFTICFEGESNQYQINLPTNIEIAKNTYIQGYYRENNNPFIIDINSGATSIILPTGNLKINASVLVKNIK